jgi:hypothetical protein
VVGPCEHGNEASGSIKGGHFLIKPVSIAARSKASTVFGRSNIGIAGSNPGQGMDVCLCCPV